MSNKDFTTSFITQKTPTEVFNNILDVRSWWSGLYGEKIKGNTDKLNEEFTFTAGEGMHKTKQKLIELIPGKKVVWLVTDSKLTFLTEETEWTGTKIIFEIDTKDGQTEVHFIHQGLAPQIECHKECSNAWSQYLQKFAIAMNK